MRITQRQLRQIIREELNRSMREADETAQDVVALPPEPKKRSIFGHTPTAEETTWNAAWEDLSQGEKDTFLAAVKNSPDLPTIVGTAVRNGDFVISRFTDMLNMPYPAGGSKVFESLVGGTTARGLPIGTVIKQLADKFSNNDMRAANFAKLGIRLSGGSGTRLDRLVYDNAYLVAGLERMYVGEGLYNDDVRGGLKPPREGSQLAKFVYAALGI